MTTNGYPREDAYNILGKVPLRLIDRLHQAGVVLVATALAVSMALSRQDVAGDRTVRPLTSPGAQPAMAPVNGAS